MGRGRGRGVVREVRGSRSGCALFRSSARSIHQSLFSLTVALKNVVGRSTNSRVARNLYPIEAVFDFGGMQQALRPCPKPCFARLDAPIATALIMDIRRGISVFGLAGSSQSADLTQSHDFGADCAFGPFHGRRFAPIVGTKSLTSTYVLPNSSSPGSAYANPAVSCHFHATAPSRRRANWRFRPPVSTHGFDGNCHSLLGFSLMR